MRAHKTWVPFLLTSLLSLFLVACFGGGHHGGGGGGGNGGGGGGNPTTVQILNKQNSIPAGSQFVFNAQTMHNHGNPLGVNWTLTPASGEGTLTNPTNPGNGNPSAVTYTAPMTTCNNCVTIAATSIENASSTDSDTFSITAAGSGATVSLIQPGVLAPQVVAGSTLSLEATVNQFDNGSGVNWGVQAGNTCTVNPDFTTTSSLGTQGGSASLGTVPANTAKNTVVTYTPPSPAPVAPNNVFTITAVQSPSTTGPCVVVTVVPTNNSLLSVNLGNFVFRFRGFTSAGQTFAIIGRFHADGVGSADLSKGITAGLEDVNIAQTGGSSVSFTEKAFTGGYNMDSPSHGTMKLIVSPAPWAAIASNPPLTMNFSFTLSLDGTFGGLIETDSNAALAYAGSGDFQYQGNSKNFKTTLIVGSYVVSLEGPAGVTATAVHKGIVGRFDLTATTLTGGTFTSTSDDQTGPMLPAPSGNYTIDDQPNGHGSFTVTSAGSLHVITFYIGGPGRFYALRTDPNPLSANPDGILAGVVRAIAVDMSGQTIAFDNTSLSGSFIFNLLGITTNGNSSAAAGHFSGMPGVTTTDGFLTGNLDLNDGGSVSTNVTFSGLKAAFTIDSRGRGIMSIPVGGVTYNFVFYARSPGGGFLLEQPASDNSNRGRSGGWLVQTSGPPFAASGANGTYILSTAVVTAASRNTLAVLSLNGGTDNFGSFNGTSYSSVVGSVPTTNPISGTFTVTDMTSGRGTLTLASPGATIAGNAQLAFEVYDPANAILVGIDNININTEAPIISLDE
jgi:hypothetical protein